MLILASSSPRRQEIIRSLRLPFEVYPSHVDETIEASLTPSEAVTVLAERKASAVKEKLNGSMKGVIIGSDTVVVLGNDILGKPVNPQDAFAMLKRLQGRSHQVYSGIACIDAAEDKRVVQYRSTLVHMRSLSDDQIERYIESGEPMDKAGSYAIQGLGAALVDSIEGDYFNVVGLSVALLTDMLKEFGIAVP
ncbi:Maf family protein [Marinicrinis lubricantis]|uniref:dTTP/UTP pyrophosphatase n=1 Tax=Marinicrinis lubricantis TaxID=2086470 RepID=A0ABW1ITM5_9BACL